MMIKAALAAGKKCLWVLDPPGGKVRVCFTDTLFSPAFLGPLPTPYRVTSRAALLDNMAPVFLPTAAWSRHEHLTFSYRPIHSPSQRPRPQNATQPDPIRILSLDFSNCSGRGDSLSSTGWSWKVSCSGGWFMISTSRRNQVSRTVKNKMVTQKEEEPRQGGHLIPCPMLRKPSCIALPFWWLGYFSTYSYS